MFDFQLGAEWYFLEHWNMSMSLIYHRWSTYTRENVFKMLGFSCWGAFKKQNPQREKIAVSTYFKSDAGSDSISVYTVGVLNVVDVVVQMPRTQMTTIFEGQPPKTRPFPFETRAIWVPGIYISCSPRVYLFSCHCERCLETTGGFSSATSKGQDTTRVQRAESGIYEYVVSWSPVYD